MVFKSPGQQESTEIEKEVNGETLQQIMGELGSALYDPTLSVDQKSGLVLKDGEGSRVDTIEKFQSLIKTDGFSQNIIETLLDSNFVIKMVKTPWSALSKQILKEKRPHLSDEVFEMITSSSFTIYNQDTRREMLSFGTIYPGTESISSNYHTG